jgi:Mor family transcriptional regulator
MIDLELTKEKYGYRPEDLSAGSSKDIYVRCDYCFDHTVKTYKAYLKQRKIVAKDACGKLQCKYKKREDMSLCKHGVKNSAQREEVRSKIRDTNIDRLQSKEFKEQIKKTNLQKYGNENPMLVQSIVEKQKETLLNRYGVNNIMKYADTAKKAAQKMKQTKIDKGIIKTYEGKSRPDLAKEIGFSRSHFGKLVNKYGMEEAIKMEPFKTKLEKTFEDFLQNYNINYVTQFRINKKIADFKIDNLLIEVDGLYWHSDVAKVDMNYHINKKTTYENAGYDSLFFREDEIRDKFEIVKSMVLNRLGRSNKVFARKCHMGILNNKDADVYFETNHLMGKGRGTTYVLTFKEEIVAALRLKRNKNNDYEISRFCNSKFYTVTGAFSKLLSFAIKDKHPDSIMTFIDKRYGKGNYLKDLGFSYIHTYPSFRWTDGFETFHRLKFPGNSGYNKDLFKIYDCGQAKYYLTLK